jgi:glycosyltransferase involved in cell wall biosynthesis
MPKVSVIIPTFNRSNFVGNAVDSVLRQSFKDFEVIVVDDGSTDATRPALEYCWSKISYIYQVNAGVSAARNTGIQSAKGEWLAFLDSDDEWHAEYLSTQMLRVGATPGIRMQTTDCSFIARDGQIKSYFTMNRAMVELKGRDYFIPQEPFSFILKHSPWQVGATIFKYDAVVKAGLFDTSVKISEDLDLMARVALLGPFGLIRESLVNIHRREETIECLTQQAKNDPLQSRESDERLYQKLAGIGTLNSKQRGTLNSQMSANRRAMGNHLRKQGRATEARDCYKRAFLMDHSIKSLGRCILSWLQTGSKMLAGTL